MLSHLLRNIELINKQTLNLIKKMNNIYTNFLKKDYHPFYPKMLLNADTGEDIRIIAQHSEIS